MGKDKNVVVRMFDAQFSYTYEYFGNGAKLVHTPLTDKCFLTLTQVCNNLYLKQFVVLFKIVSKQFFFF